MHASLFINVGQGNRAAWGSGEKPCTAGMGKLRLSVQTQYEFVWQMHIHLFTRRQCQLPTGPCSYKRARMAAYLPGLQNETSQRVVSTSMQRQLQSAFQNPKSAILPTGIALKETIVGAKIVKITGEQPAVTTVNYFTGNDKSKWKTNVPSYNIVNLGEVYKGIELSLKAYGQC